MKKKRPSLLEIAKEAGVNHPNDMNAFREILDKAESYNLRMGVTVDINNTPYIQITIFDEVKK